MKLKETPSYTPHRIDIEANYDEIGNDHVAGSVDTPLRSDAFDISGDSFQTELFRVIDPPKTNRFFIWIGCCIESSCDLWSCLKG